MALETLLLGNLQDRTELEDYLVRVHEQKRSLVHLFYKKSVTDARIIYESYQSKM